MRVSKESEAPPSRSKPGFYGELTMGVGALRSLGRDHAAAGVKVYGRCFCRQCTGIVISIQPWVRTLVPWVRAAGSTPKDVLAARSSQRSVEALLGAFDRKAARVARPARIAKAATPVSGRKISKIETPPRSGFRGAKLHSMVGVTGRRRRQVQTSRGLGCAAPG